MGSIDCGVLETLMQVLRVLRANGFEPRYVARDGHAAMNELHSAFFHPYAHMNGDLESIYGVLERSNRISNWPVSDMLHLFKNIRTRLAMGRLALDDDPNTAVITGTSVSAELESKGVRIGTTLVDHRSLDLLRDPWPCGDYSACYFMLPFVCLNLAVRNAHLLPGQRLELIHLAFIAFFHLIRWYPETGGEAEI
jgi:hypothetical protein